MKHILQDVEIGVKKYWPLLFAISLQIFLVGSLWTFHATDSSWFYHTTQAQGYKTFSVLQVRNLLHGLSIYLENLRYFCVEYRFIFYGCIAGLSFFVA